jgi:hypothetical protein
MVEGKAVTPKLLQMREAVAFTFGGQPSLAYLMLAAISFIAIVALIAVCATYSALRLRYGRRPVVAIALLPIWFLATILMGIALRSGAISKETMTVYLASSACAFAAVMLLATGYMLWTGFRDRALTIGYVSGAVLVSIAMVLACLPSDSIFTLLLPGLIPLIPAIAAPWSLGRVRHT